MVLSMMKKIKTVREDKEYKSGGTILIRMCRDGFPEKCLSKDFK